MRLNLLRDFPGGSDGKKVKKQSACNAGNMDLTPRLGRSSGGGNGYLLQYFCLENLLDRGAQHHKA